MNLVDVILILIILLSVWSGYRRGFILGALDLLFLAISILFAFWAYPYVAVFFDRYITSLGVWTLPVSFIISFLFVRILLSAFARRFIQKIPETSHRHVLNRTLGFVPGLVNGVINAAIVSALLLGLPIFDGLTAKTRDSYIANELTPHVEYAEEKFAPVFDQAINHTINKLSVDPNSNKTIKLNFSVTDATVREDLEAQMLELVNEERLKEGLNSLKPDPEMREVARLHSRDMFARSYFSHYSPEGKTLADRAREKKVRYLVAGENLALAQTLRIAHRGLMNSPGHRANILHKSYGRVGIGILEGGRHGIMVTQNFRN
jgi:uncharacterized protein YkwD